MDYAGAGGGGGGGGFIPDDEGGWADGGGGRGGFLGGSCCEDCGNISFSGEMYQAYKILVCASCKQADKYKLIPKGAAKDQYMLTDGDLKRLGFITKSNPQRKQWSDMKLYLQLQVEMVAVKKHGSLTAIRDLKQDRVQARLASRVNANKRTIAELQARGEGPEEDHEDLGPPVDAPLNPTQQRVRARLNLEYASCGGEDATSGVSGGGHTSASHWVKEPAVMAVSAETACHGVVTKKGRQGTGASTEHVLTSPQTTAPDIEEI